jgi:rhodanese-related sulfurtransferase
MDGSIKEISPIEAWEMLGSQIDSILVDVRALDEIKTLGYADITSFNKNVVLIPWINDLVSRDVNENFLTDLDRKVPNKDAKIIFMCKAGMRSFDAAMVAVNGGYTSCFNLATGFGQGVGDSGWKSIKLACKEYV